MNNPNQSQTASTITLAIDSVNAYSLALEVVSELSAIFEAINMIARSGSNDAHVSDRLSSVGFSYATERLHLITMELADANAKLDAIRNQDLE